MEAWTPMDANTVEVYVEPTKTDIEQTEKLKHRMETNNSAKTDWCK